MDKWKVDFKNEKRESVIVEADLLVTNEDGAIEFYQEKKPENLLVDWFTHDEWKQVTKG